MLTSPPAILTKEWRAVTVLKEIVKFKQLRWEKNSTNKTEHISECSLNKYTLVPSWREHHETFFSPQIIPEF